MTIAHIVGNRPQFIKLSLLHRALARHDGVHSRIIHTGQHFSDNMSAAFFREFDLPEPDEQLQINHLPHGEMIGQMLVALDRSLAARRPDIIVVYGDTNTTLAGSLAAKKRNIPLAHVEAGIRTGDEGMPEESNRYISDRLADIRFACTRLNVNHLLKEGMPPHTVYHTGDLMLDAALYYRHRATQDSPYPDSLLAAGQPFVLATIHRAENTDDPEALHQSVAALNAIHAEIPVVFPVHPRTTRALADHRLTLDVATTPPLGYLDMLALAQASSFVITDSGGLSREAFFFCKPSVIVMKHPFWPETFDNGPSLSSLADTRMILERFSTVRSSLRPFDTAIFGDGHAAKKISDILINRPYG
jgi:UDP-GlcNAc3NAcA epimerase